MARSEQKEPGLAQKMGKRDRRTKVGTFSWFVINALIAPIVRELSLNRCYKQSLINRKEIFTFSVTY